MSVNETELNKSFFDVIITYVDTFDKMRLIGIRPNDSTIGDY